MNKCMKTFLTLSLLLNLLLLGITCGYTCKKLQFHMMEQHRPITVSEMTSVLAPEKQKNLQSIIEKSEEETKVQRDQLVVERRKSFDLLQATPFNKDAYIAQIKVTEDLHARIVEGMATVVLQIAEQSSDAERASIAQMMIERQNAQQQASGH